MDALQQRVTNGQSASDIHHSDDKLLLSTDDDTAPTLSVMIPTLNERGDIAQCIEWVRTVLEGMQICGKVVIADSSTDRMSEIATENGVIVIESDDEGYGYTYLHMFEHARGGYIATGDADCTYNFEELPKLLNMVRSGGADMATGSQLGGEIPPGLMPPLYEHVGNPLLTKFLSVFYGAGVNDVHSGMCVSGRDAQETVDCSSTGMESTSEMIMEASARNLEIRGEPTTCHPREDEANLENFPDGRRYVRFMFVDASGYLLSTPGFELPITDILALVLAWSGVEVDGAQFGVHIGVDSDLLTLIGFQLVLFEAFPTMPSDPVRGASDPSTAWFTEHISLERGVTIGSVVLLYGLTYGGPLALAQTASGSSALSITVTDVVAIVAVVVGLQMVFGPFLLSSLRE